MPNGMLVWSAGGASILELAWVVTHGQYREGGEIYRDPQDRFIIKIFSLQFQDFYFIFSRTFLSDKTWLKNGVKSADSTKYAMNVDNNVAINLMARFTSA